MPTPRVVRRRRAIKAAMGALAIGLVAAIIVYSWRVPLSPEEMAGLSVQEGKILKLVNEERVRAGLKPLALSPRLAVIGRAHSYDMAIRHYLAHDSPEGSTPADRLRGVEITYQELGENIYMDDFADLDGLPGRAVRRWLESPEHRANMLSPSFRETGVGVARSSDGKSYITQDFIR